MQNLLTYPHLLLFAYHKSDNSSWEDLRKSLAIADNSQNDFDGFKYHKSDGFYHCNQMGDSQGLLVGLATAENSTDISELAKFYQEKLCNVQGNLGRTWLILGYGDMEEKNAKTAYETVTGKTAPNLHSGQFLDGNWWEIWQPLEGDTYVVCIFPNKESLEAIGKFFFDLMWLFYYRHKMIWAYGESRKLKNALVKEDVFPKLDNLPTFKVSTRSWNVQNDKDFQELRQQLAESLIKLPKHTVLVEALGVQLQTLRTNLAAYDKRYERMQGKLGEGQKLKIFGDFREKILPGHEAHIDQDYLSLSPGLRVRQSYIDALSGFVEVSIAARERRIENAIAGGGIGIGVASASASAMANFSQTMFRLPQQDPNTNELNLQNAWANYGIILGISLGLGFGLGWRVWKHLNKKRRV
ncbi:MAG TPA: hypothetical protein IGS52_20235 [Oscillatoriaceae cyanobacterium M33_DOE_052]|uniref:Uncharacterized protein n=1 Tax=Planktothricoides sp. SpSt-374 TaxID=2282167 RepID=A0A7C3VEV8_9CYAN|nr:hypothetical protein [Oscillatoriaceae cyanobacterium M33_DOE_052]